MSKAFTRESDDAPETRPMLRPASALPPGAKNYLTPNGARQKQEELDTLLAKRPATAAVETRHQVSDPARRIAQLQQCLASAVITPPPAPPWEQARFGATVTVRSPNGDESRYRIVGVEETDLDRDWVSWLSPIARALLNASIGERVRFQFPDGEAQLEIVALTYD